MTKHTHILVIEELAWPYGGGGELATYLWVRLLSRRYRVTLLTAKIGKKEKNVLEECGVEVVHAPWIDVSSRHRVWATMERGSEKLRKIIRDRADIVLVARLGYPALRIAAEEGVVSINHLHDYVAIDPSGVRPSRRYTRAPLILLLGPRRYLKRLAATPLWRRYISLLDLASASVFVSARQRDITCRARPRLCRNASVIHNPLPPLEAAEPPRWLPRRFVLYGGGPSRLKGAHIVRRLAGHLVEHGLYVVATGFPVKHPTEKGGVVYAPRLSHGAYLATLREAEALLFPSIQEEPLPYAVVEAVLLGKPVLATRVGGVPEILGEEYPLYIRSFSNHDLASVAASLEKLGEEAAAHARRRSQKLLSDWSPEKLLDRFESLLSLVEEVKNA